MEKMCLVSHWSLLGIHLWPLADAVPGSASLKDMARLEARGDVFSTVLVLR